MKKLMKRRGGLLIALMTVLLLWCVQAQAVIDGEEGTDFTLVAKQDRIKTPDGDKILMWGYALGPDNPMWYPGPTLIVNEGDTVTVTLINELPPQHGQNVSIVFPGHVVTATGGVAGALTREAGFVDNPDVDPTTVTYTFVATHPGTYIYRSGTRPDLQVEMGLVGALIVRPHPAGLYGGSDPDPQDRDYSPPIKYAYNSPDTYYHYEYLYLVTEIDVNIHRLVAKGRIDEVDTTTWFPVHWFVNGRAWPDLAQPPFVPWLKNQPYNCLPRTHPFEKMLVRVIGAGRQLHPMHYHGADFSVKAMDGRLLTSGEPNAGADLAWSASTINFTPGQTADFFWEWTGKDLGWDFYGHSPGGDPVTDPPDPYMEGYEYQDPDPNNDPPKDDHHLPFPVILAGRDDLAFGAFYSGSPWLGAVDDLPTGHPGLNSGGAFVFPWHSHSEKELTSNDVFPGGALSFVFLEYPTECILETQPGCEPTP